MSQEIGIVPPPGRTCAEAVERYLATCARSDEIVRSSRTEGGVEVRCTWWRRPGGTRARPTSCAS